MGTRNLTCVIVDGEYKVAQYGQWEGYPEGQGATIFEFLQKADLRKFKKALKKIRFLEPKGKDKIFLEEYNKSAPQWSNDPDNRTSEQKRWFETYSTRNIGADILQNIYDSQDEEILLNNQLDFAGDGLMCEWVYILNFDTNELEVYEGFNKKSLTEEDKFFDLQEKGEEYTPVKRVFSFPLLLLAIVDVKYFVETCMENSHYNDED